MAPTAPRNARLSISSDTTVGSQRHHAPLDNGHSGAHTAEHDSQSHPRRTGQYAILSVLVDASAPPPLLPAFPSLAQNPYVPNSLSSLGTSFTASGLPASSSKSVAQRRSQAPPVVISESRKVLRSEFDKYLGEVRPEWERWEKERRLGREGAINLGSNGASGGGVGLGIGTTRTEDEMPGSAKRKAKEEELPPLDGVPQIFFDPAFNLSNPRTFDLVTERIRLSPSTSPNTTHAETMDTPTGPALEPIPGLGPLTLADLATDQILQEKLSHYTAVIESHLVWEIGLRSSSFFSALSNLQSLHEQGENCLSKIAELQAALSPEDKGVGGAAKRGLQVLRGQARRRGLEKIEEGVRSVEEVWSGVEGVKELVEQGEWMGALQVSEQVESLYYGFDAEENDNDEEERTPTPTTVDIVVSPSTTTDDPAKPRRPKRARLNLTRIKALDSVPKKLALFRAQVARSLESELIAVLDHEMEVGVEEYMRLAGTGSWKGKGREDSASSLSPASPANVRSPIGIVLSPISFVDDGETGEDLARERAQERVRPVVRGLMRSDGMESAVGAWRESVLKVVRSMVREHLPTSETPAEDEDAFAGTSGRPSLDTGSVSDKSLSLARGLRALPHAAFLSLARDTYLGLLGCIEVVDIHARVLVELTSEARDEERVRKARRRAAEDEDAAPNDSSLMVPNSGEAPSRPSLTLSTSSLDSKGSNEDSTLASDITDVVHATAELANLRFSKVIGVRTDVHSNLSLAEFVEIFDASWAFVLQCEVVCQRMIVGLRGVMVGQSKMFLQTYHQKRITEAAKVVENEQWSAADVPHSTQIIVNLILQSAVSDPPEFLLGKRRRTTNGAVEEAFVAATPTKQLDIEGREYFSVPAGLACVEVLADYLKVVMNCPLLTTDAMSKVVEYMKSFNSRTCQVVLGAGAMRSAGLKNITAKHLALASQALSIMISLIPYIRETLRRHLNPKQAVMLIEFDKLKRDYQEHQNEIHSKLVAIMSDRLQIHCKTLEAIDWEQPIPGRKEGLPNVYMEALIKEHTTLHKVLSRFMQAATVEYIMMQVFSALNAGLAEEYGKINVRTEAAKQRMMVDVHYLKVRLAELQGMERGTPGAELENLIETKQLPASARTVPRRVSVAPPSASPPPLSSAPPTPSPSTPSSPSPPAPPALPSLPPPDTLPASSTPLPPAPTPAPPPAVPKPAPRKSMAERLADLARRGSVKREEVVLPSNGIKTSELPMVPQEDEVAAFVAKEEAVVFPAKEEVVSVVNAEVATPAKEESVEPAKKEPVLDAPLTPAKDDSSASTEEDVVAAEAPTADQDTALVPVEVPATSEELAVEKKVANPPPVAEDVDASTSLVEKPLTADDSASREPSLATTSGDVDVAGADEAVEVPTSEPAAEVEGEAIEVDDDAAIAEILEDGEGLEGDEEVEMEMDEEESQFL